MLHFWKYGIMRISCKLRVSCFMGIGNQFTRVVSSFDSILIYTEEDTRIFTVILSLLVFQLMVRTSENVKIGKYKGIVV